MSAYPLMLDGESLSAVIVGGGPVATRKVAALVRSGARVRVVAPSFTPELEALAASDAVHLTRGRYSSSHIGDALFVIAATDDAATNSLVATDARRLGRLVNVVSAPDEGNCITPAVHVAGDVVVAVSAGGVPAAAARIRDVFARTLDGRYAEAIRELAVLRRSLIGGGNRERWSAAAGALIGEDFCAAVESGSFAERAAQWR